MPNRLANLPEHLDLVIKAGHPKLLPKDFVSSITCARRMLKFEIPHKNSTSRIQFNSAEHSLVYLSGFIWTPGNTRFHKSHRELTFVLSLINLTHSESCSGQPALLRLGHVCTRTRFYGILQNQQRIATGSLAWQHRKHSVLPASRWDHPFQKQKIESLIKQKKISCSYLFIFSYS